MRAKKISRGVYEYKGYEISNCGYHHPDHCIWWEAVNIKTGCADYHDNTKKEVMDLIDRDIINNTKNIDECECIYCHHKWDGNQATNYDTGETVIKCPKCGKTMGVLQSVEYECYELEE